MTVLLATSADLPDGENLLLLQSRPETVHSSKAASQTPPQPAAAGGYFSGLSHPTPPVTPPVGTAPSSAPPASGSFSLGSITASLLKPSF